MFNCERAFASIGSVLKTAKSRFCIKNKAVCRKAAPAHIESLALIHAPT